MLEQKEVILAKPQGQKLCYSKLFPKALDILSDIIPPKYLVNMLYQSTSNNSSITFVDWNTFPSLLGYCEVKELER